MAVIFNFLNRNYCCTNLIKGIFTPWYFQFVIRWRVVMSHGFSLGIILQKVFILIHSWVCDGYSSENLIFLRRILILDQSLSVSHSCILSSFLILFFDAYFQKDLRKQHWHIDPFMYCLPNYVLSTSHIPATILRYRRKRCTKYISFTQKFNINWVIKTNI